MPRRTDPIYQRGKYKLKWDERADGTRRSPYLTIFWHDEATRRVRSASTRTASEEEAVIALDRRYLADRGEAQAYCHTCGRPIASASAYLVTDAIADYRLEVGDDRTSGATIATRLNHVVDFLTETDRTALTCEEACLPAFADKLRRWSRAKPVEHRDGGGHVTKTRVRAPATTEAAIGQFAAALNHAANERRSDQRPQWKPLQPGQVNRRRRTRTGIDVIADMVAYAAEPVGRRLTLHAFLIGTLCTLARPSSVFAISTDPARRMWRPGAAELELNPAGRAQNKKLRPTLPVLPLLERWLLETLADTHAKEPRERTGGWLVNYYGEAVRDVRSSWEAMLIDLKLPLEREWRSYLLRHSLATLVRGAGVPRWELEAWMGHNSGSTTEVYAVEAVFPNVMPAIQHIIDEIASRAPGALHRTRTGAPVNIQRIGAPRMPSP